MPTYNLNEEGKQLRVEREHTNPYFGVQEVSYKSIRDIIEDNSFAPDKLRFVNQFIELNGLDKESVYQAILSQRIGKSAEGDIVLSRYPDEIVPFMKETGKSEEEIRKVLENGAELAERNDSLEFASRLYEAAGNPGKAMEMAAACYRRLLGNEMDYKDGIPSETIRKVQKKLLTALDELVSE